MSPRIASAAVRSSAGERGGPWVPVTSAKSTPSRKARRSRAWSWVAVFDTVVAAHRSASVACSLWVPATRVWRNSGRRAASSDSS